MQSLQDSGAAAAATASTEKAAGGKDGSKNLSASLNNRSEARLSSMYRESKIFRQKFRTLLEAGDVRPTTPNLEFSRKELRNVYLKLLFHYTFVGRTRGIEGSLWAETTHPLVHLYRSTLSSFEQEIRKATTATQQSPTSKKAQQHAQTQLTQTAHAYARFANNFRAFLADEEAFWRDLAGRMARLYNVQEAYRSLRSLDILSAENKESNNATGLARIIGLDGISIESQEQALLPANRARLIDIIHRTLICCGDLARYSELYREEPQVNAKEANQRGGMRGRGRGRGGAGRAIARDPPAAKRERDFTRAANCYEQARHLLPSNGNPWNQLAVLATYRGDYFTFVYSCYRALCVSEPFDKAKGNMEKTLRKTLDKWLEAGNLSKFTSALSNDTASPSGDVSVATLLHDLVILHTAFFLRNEAVLSSAFPEHCLSDIETLLQQRALQTDLVVQISVTTIAALWLRRLWRGNSPTGKNSGVASSMATEQNILLHLCGLASTMFDIGAQEMMEALSSSNGPTVKIGDAGATGAAGLQGISAVLRRMLPAVRIMSKWLKSHLEYVNKLRQQQSQQSLTSASGEESSAASAFSVKAHAQLSLGIDRLWNSYASFVNVMRYSFPFDALPTLGTSVGQSGMSGIDFEEDRDMLGFTPMKKSLMGEGLQGSMLSSNERFESQTPTIDPNDEHLIRIADILIDAKVIAETESSPIHFDDAKNSFFLGRSQEPRTDHARASEVQQQMQPLDRTVANPSLTRSKEEDEADDDCQNASESSEDAVDLAMRAVDERRRALAGEGSHDVSTEGYDGCENANNDDEDVDDDEEIILIPSAVRRAPKAQDEETNAAAVPPSDALNAQHLLLQVLHGSPSIRAQSVVAHDVGVDASTASSEHGLAVQRPFSGGSFGPIGSPLPRGPASAGASTNSHNVVSAIASGAPQGSNASLWSNADTNSVMQPAQQQHRIRPTADIWGGSSGLPFVAGTSSPGAPTAAAASANPTTQEPIGPLSSSGWPAPTATSPLVRDWSAPSASTAHTQKQPYANASSGAKW